MKRLVKTIIVLAACVLCSSSCEKWLEATSSTQIQADKLLTSREGFQDALSGIYINMGDSDLYGGAVTWNYSDLVCYPYNQFSSTQFNCWQKHNYTNMYVESGVTRIWQQFYNVIAGINQILPYLEERHSIFSSELEYNLVKGELLGLRAYLHFDLMRYFGVNGWDDSCMGKLTVPYVTEFSMNVTPQRTYSETIALLNADLDEAVKLLEKDPVRGVKPDGFDQGPNAEGFWNKRTTHLNYYAARMLQARVQQWSGNYEESAQIAQSILDEVFDANVVKWIDCESMLTSVDTDSRDWSFTVEQIFMLDITGLYGNVVGELIPGRGDADAFHINYDFINTTLYPLSEGGSIAGAEDIRGTAFMMKYDAQAYDCYKLYGESTLNSAYRNKMPMMKLPELYYLIAENYLAKGDNAKARETLDIVRANRGIQKPFATTVNVPLEFNKEIMREFVDEGQIFHWFKHHGLDNYPGAAYFNLTQDAFTFPYPQSERNYGRVQEL